MPTAREQERKQVITNGKTNNRDVPALEDMLKELKEQIVKARAVHERAASLLTDPAGFDEDGQVTDRKIALETVKEIRHLQQETRKLIGDSIRDAFQAIREFRQDKQDS